MRRLASPGWIASHLFVVVMVVLMFNLGLWQLRRLDDRRTDNTVIAAAIAAEPVDVAAYLDEFGAPPDYTAVATTGTYLADVEVRIANRSSGGQPGFWLATPLQLQDGRIIAVVRGWVPRRILADLDDRSVAAPTDSVIVAGLAFESVSGGRVAQVSLGDTPEISQVDLIRFAEVTGLDVEDVWIRLRAQSPTQTDGLPVPVPDPDLGEGSHLSYAFQWFFFTAGTVVVYGLILRRALTRRQVSGDMQLQL